jgi:Protein interacting with poly(A)-binding protein
MNWSGSTARRCGAAVALAATATLMLPLAANAQTRYERSLAGIRLNSQSTSVLRLYGNPNEVVIGNTGVRLPPQGGQGGQGQQGTGFPGAPGAFPGSGFPGTPGAPGAFPGSGFPGASGPARGPSASGLSAGGAASVGPRGPAGPQGRGFPGAPGGFAGAAGLPQGPGGFPGGPGGFPGGFPGAPPGAGEFGDGTGFPGSGFPGSGFPGSGFPGAGGVGGGIGAFGQTTSTLARQQEVTWIYNRKSGNDIVSYEFLIGPSGQVIQIRALGYTGPVRTSRGIKLGSDYRDVVRAYGYPESHFMSNGILVADYKNKAHAQFQFQNRAGQQGDPLKGGYKIIAITIASFE